jgi:hypothetical protein
VRMTTGSGTTCKMPSSVCSPCASAHHPTLGQVGEDLAQTARSAHRGWCRLGSAEHGIS